MFLKPKLYNDTTLFDIGMRYCGIKEVKGQLNNEHIMAMLKLDHNWPEADEVPWCSAALNFWCWLLRLPRTKSLLARSWLQIGEVVELHNAVVGYDIVILKQSGGPGASDTTSPGHVGIYAGNDKAQVLDEWKEIDESEIHILGGNQSDSVNVTGYPVERVIGVRRLYR